MKKSTHVKVFEKTKMKPDEQILLFCEGWIGNVMGVGKNTQHNGALIITNQRVVFHRKGLTGSVFQSSKYKDISSIELKYQMGCKSIKFYTYNGSLEFKTLESANKVNQIFEKTEELRETQQHSSATNSNDSIELIKKLAELKESGILTPEEFDVKKSEIMSKIGEQEKELIKSIEKRQQKQESTPHKKKRSKKGWFFAIAGGVVAGVFIFSNTPATDEQIYEKNNDKQIGSLKSKGYAAQEKIYTAFANKLAIDESYKPHFVACVSDNVQNKMEDFPLSEMVRWCEMDYNNNPEKLKQYINYIRFEEHKYMTRFKLDDLVKSMLKSPSSFKSIDYRYSFARGTDEKPQPYYKLQLVYDADNAFGATIRNYILVKVDLDTGDILEIIENFSD